MQALKGYAKMAVLLPINYRYLHGYQITKRLKEKTNEFLSLTPGTVRPLLKDLEQKRFIKGYWPKGGRRKTCWITEKGRALLEKMVWTDKLSPKRAFGTVKGLTKLLYPTVQN